MKTTPYLGRRESGEWCVCTIWLALSYTGGLWPGARCEAEPNVLLWLSQTAVAARGTGSLPQVTASGRCSVEPLCPKAVGPVAWVRKRGSSTRAAQQQWPMAKVTHLPLPLSHLLVREAGREEIPEGFTLAAPVRMSHQNSKKGEKELLFVTFDYQKNPNQTKKPHIMETGILYKYLGLS